MIEVQGADVLIVVSELTDEDIQGYFVLSRSLPVCFSSQLQGASGF